MNNKEKQKWFCAWGERIYCLKFNTLHLDTHALRIGIHKKCPLMTIRCQDFLWGSKPTLLFFDKLNWYRAATDSFQFNNTWQTNLLFDISNVILQKRELGKCT